MWALHLRGCLSLSMTLGRALDPSGLSLLSVRCVPLSSFHPGCGKDLMNHLRKTLKTVWGRQSARLHILVAVITRAQAPPPFWASVTAACSTSLFSLSWDEVLLLRCRLLCL